jgi:hypothetical protein
MGINVTLGSVRLRFLLVPVVAAALTVACGEGTLQSPVSPSASPGATALVTDGGDAVSTTASAGGIATLGRGGNGNGNGNGNGGGQDKEKDNNGPGDQNGGGSQDGGPGRSQEARVVGFVSSTSGNAIEVNGVIVLPGPGATIRHGNRTLTIGDIEVGDHVQARGAMDGAILVATEIKVQDTGRDNGDIDEADIEGVISGLSATTGCPLVTFMIGTTLVSTSETTMFDDVACAALANNLLVEVEGVRRSDGSILATRIEAEAGPDEVEGIVFDFSGAASCPAATFKVGPTLSLATTVTTTATTTFTGVTCAALTNGTRVEVEGTRQADGSIAAASVELK